AAQSVEPVVGAGAAARAGRPRDPARRRRRDRADGEAAPGPPAGYLSLNRLRQVPSLSFRSSPTGSRATAAGTCRNLEFEDGGRGKMASVEQEKSVQIDPEELVNS